MTSMMVNKTIQLMGRTSICERETDGLWLFCPLTVSSPICCNLEHIFNQQYCLLTNIFNKYKTFSVVLIYSYIKT